MDGILLNRRPKFQSRKTSESIYSHAYNAKRAASSELPPDAGGRLV